MYHYTDSGLGNVYLVNGYYEKDTPYGRAISIEDIEGLHRTIGRWLVNTAKPLNGAELRFLRQELDLSQKKLGQMMGKSEQAIGRWERAPTKVIDPIADRLIRIIYAEWMDGGGPIKDLIERLAELDQLEEAECTLEERNGRWHVADRIAA
jgi:DNA-binding transcriptional regulator YiaG